MPTIKNLETAIRRDRSAYDKAVEHYNKLVYQYVNNGSIISIYSNREGPFKFKFAKTKEGANATYAIVDAWDKIAEKGRKLSAELEEYASLTGSPVRLSPRSEMYLKRKASKHRQRRHAP